MAIATNDNLVDAYNANTATAPTGASNGLDAAYTSAASAATTPVASTPATTPQLTSASTTQDRVNEINRMYEAQQQARLNELENAYNMSRSDMQAAADKILPAYQTQANANAVDWERQRRNFLEGANMNGINTGASSQAQLAMMGQQQKTANNIRMAQANAQAEADRQMANLTAQYQADIRSALANNDYQRAAALLDEYNNGYNRDLAAAEVLAGYGDFSGYENVYGKDTAKGMADIWYQQNPDVAYITGKITKDQRDNIKEGRPINSGLDKNGKRIESAGGGSSGGGQALADILRNQAWTARNQAEANGNWNGNTAAQSQFNSIIRTASKL